MDRRTAIRRFGFATFIGFSGCSSIQNTSNETSTGKTTTTTSNLSWVYNDTDGFITDIYRTDDAIYLHDTGYNFHRIDIESGTRDWYISGINEDGVLASSGGYPIFVDGLGTEPISIHSYKPTGQHNFDVGPGDLSEMGHWGEIYPNDTLVNTTRNKIFIMGELHETSSPNCYTISLDPRTGDYESDHLWYTAGTLEALPGTNSFVMGAWKSFPPYVSRIKNSGEVIWETKISVRNFSRITNINVATNGDIYAEFTTGQSAGVIALESNGSVNWIHNQRGDPKESFNILNESVVLDEHLIIPFISDSSLSDSITLISFDRNSGGIQQQVTFDTTDSQGFASSFETVHIESDLYIGIVNDDNSASWAKIELPKLSHTGTVRTTMDPYGTTITHPQDGKFVYKSESEVGAIRLP